MHVRSPFNYDADVVSFSSGVDCSDSPSLAQQHYRDEVDINNLVARFGRTGVPPAPPAAGFVDFSEVFDFQSAMDRLIEAQKSFNSLPSGLRRRFGNDPHEFLAFVGDSANREEAQAMGLIPKPPLPVETPPAPSEEV